VRAFPRQSAFLGRADTCAVSSNGGVGGGVKSGGGSSACLSLTATVFGGGLGVRATRADEGLVSTALFRGALAVADMFWYDGLLSRDGAVWSAFLLASAAGFLLVGGVGRRAFAADFELDGFASVNSATEASFVVCLAWFTTTSRFFLEAFMTFRSEGSAGCSFAAMNCRRAAASAARACLLKEQSEGTTKACLARGVSIAYVVRCGVAVVVGLQLSRADVGQSSGPSAINV
jgi:hypothetical protein